MKRNKSEPIEITHIHGTINRQDGNQPNNLNNNLKTLINQGGNNIVNKSQNHNTQQQKVSQNTYNQNDINEQLQKKVKLSPRPEIMNFKFQRPENLSKEIPIYHVSCPDHNADLLLKITAMGSNRIAVIPTFKAVVAVLIPNYFGEIFKEGKNFKESRLEKGEYFECKIPNLIEPKLFAEILNNLQRDEAFGRGIHAKNYDQVYHIANFFGIERLLGALRRLTLDCSNFDDSSKYNIGMFSKMSLVSANDDSFDALLKNKDFFNLTANGAVKYRAPQIFSADKMTEVDQSSQKCGEITDKILSGISGSLPIHVSNLAKFAKRHSEQCNMGLSFQCFNKFLTLEMDENLMCKERTVRVYDYKKDQKRWKNSSKFSMNLGQPVNF